MPAVQDLENVSLHWFDPFGSKSIDDIVSQPQFDVGHRIIFWDQEPLYREHTQKFFDEFCEIYRPSRPPAYRCTITLITSEFDSQDVAWVQDTYNIDNTGYYFFHGWAALDWYRGYDHCFLSTPWMSRQFAHRIFSLNNIVGAQRSHRLVLLSEMDQHDLINRNVISFPSVCPYENTKVSELFEQHNLPPLQTGLPLIIDSGKNHAANSHRIDLWKEAQSCFCHVVTETVYTSSKIHLTEKTFKPIVMQQPFMLVAPRGSLGYLKRYGFRTFADIWDESYDDADDPDRIGLIAKNLSIINSWTESQLSDAQHQIKDVIVHNHDWFYGGFQDVLWQELTAMIASWR